MSASALRLFAIVLIVIAVGLGGLAYMMNQGANTANTTPAQTTNEPADDRIEAVVATAPLAPYQKIKAEDVALVPISVTPSDYFKSVDKVVGRKPVRSVDQGTPLSPATFSTPSALSKAIPPGTEAMSLSVSDVVAVGGFVKPGDFVDVLIYIRASGSEVDDTQARILLRNARLLAYNRQLINGDQADDDNNRRSHRTAVVAVPDKLMTRVMLGASIGELRLALRRSVEPDTQQSMVAVENGSEEAGPRPEAVSPAATPVADKTADKSGDESSSAAGMSPEEREETGGVEQVITLKELSTIKAEQKDKSAPAPSHHHRRARPRPTVEIYEGVKSHRVSRPH